MKKLFFFLLIGVNIGFSQISVSENPLRNSKKINQNTLERFKKTETIFVLPDAFHREIYQKILKEQWEITPFKLVSKKDFSFKNYLNDKYSFFYLNTDVKALEKATDVNIFIFATLDLFMLKNEALKKALSKSGKDGQKLIEKNKIQLARISLYPKNKFLKPIANARSNPKAVHDLVYSKNVFYDFNLGFLKNEIQKINHQLKEEKTYNSYKSAILPEIKNLKQHTLYVPEYLGIRFNGIRETHVNKQVNQVTALFKQYDYSYAIIKATDLSDKIMRGEIGYYAKYTRINTQRYLNVINAKTGEIIYSNNMSGFGYNLHVRHILSLNSAINKNFK